MNLSFMNLKFKLISYLINFKLIFNNYINLKFLILFYIFYNFIT